MLMRRCASLRRAVLGAAFTASPLQRLVERFTAGDLLHALGWSVLLKMAEEIARFSDHAREVSRRQSTREDST